MDSPLPAQNHRAAKIREAIRNAADIQPTFGSNDLVKGWLSEGAFSVLYGPSNSGKTFVALSIAANVAAGRPWFGCQTRKSRVLYIALEGGRGFENRMAAIVERIPELRKTQLLYFLTMPLDLYSEEGLKDLCEALPEDDFGLIVVDTLARAMAGADENSTRDMGQLVCNMDWLREVTGAHVMMIHHSGKDMSKGARGSSALRAAVDTEISLSEGGRMEPQKQRDMACAASLYIDICTVSLGVNKEGLEATSAIAVAGNSPKENPDPLQGPTKVAMQALREAVQQSGEINDRDEIPSDQFSVDIKNWREAFEKLSLAARPVKKEALRKAFDRAKKKLIDTERVFSSGDLVWEAAPD